jgi:MinD-like ATPase involved in chromosome partitioning or flagellar assembly
MLSAVIISPDISLSEGVQRLAMASRQVTIHKSLEHFISPYELMRVCNVCDPDLLFLDLSDWSAASAIVEKMCEAFPKTAILGIGGLWVAENREELLHSGISALLITPLALPGFQDAVLSAFRAARGGILPSLVAFLPAKAGNGSSITAFNVAGALAEEVKKRVLLLEGDLHSGILCIRAQFATDQTLEQILDDPAVLNRSEWLRYVVRRHGIDILPAGRSRVQTEPRWSNYYHLLQFVDTEYETIVADLPETINDATAEVVLRATTIYVVATAEKPSLDLACRRFEELDQLGISPQRVQVVINRWHPTDPTPEELEEQLHRKVAKTIPNDYETVRAATAEGRLIARTNKIGVAHLALARQIAGLGDEPPTVPDEASKPRFSFAALLGR